MLDMIKIIDTFLQHTPALPRVLRQHVSYIEEDILQEAAWRSDDPKALGEVFSCIKTNSSEASPHQNLFTRKVCLLGHTRIKETCAAISLPFGIVRQVYNTFKYVLYHHPGLLQDRHLD